jgi:NAD(P)-dependent dehydrogenase (short-subunit alcohol dehydrogenase family)
MTEPNLKDRLAIVTGATAGVGLYTAMGLARLGATLIVTGRNEKRLAETVRWIQAKVPGARIEIEQADFSSLSQVRAMGVRILTNHPKIDILINNAGLVMPSRVVTEDGFETTFQVNHLSPFLLTDILLPALKAGAPSRIVNVTSQASNWGRIDFEDLNGTRNFQMWRAYSQSKLANIMFTYELARRLEGSGVTITAVHPGFVASNFGNKGLWSNLIWKLLRPVQIGQAEGAENSLYASTSPTMEGVSGQYLVSKKPVRSKAQSYDKGAVERLWRISAKMVGISGSS